MRPAMSPDSQLSLWPARDSQTGWMRKRRTKRAVMETAQVTAKRAAKVK